MDSNMAEAPFENRYADVINPKRSRWFFTDSDMGGYHQHGSFEQR